MPSGGGTPVTINQNLSSANANCAASLVSPLVCTVTLNLSPGSYQASFTTFDGPLDAGGAPTGNALSANLGFPVTIVPGTSNGINVTLQGIPQALAVIPAGATGVAGTGASFSLGRCAATQTISVVALDADGNFIVGPGAPTPALTTTATGYTIASPTASAPNTFVMTPTTTPIAGASITLTAQETPAASSGSTTTLTKNVVATFSVDYCGSGKWIAAWADAADHSTVQGGAPGSEMTFRVIAKPSVGSRGTIRLHFSNVVGAQSVTIGAVHVGVQSSGASVQPGTDQIVTFGGSLGTTIAAGATATSDPLPMQFTYGTVLAVTEYISGAWMWLPGNLGGYNVTQYETLANAGNTTNDLAGTSFTNTLVDVNLLDRIDVIGGDYKETVALIGSSTASGYGSDLNQFDDLSDDIAKNLHAAGRDDTSVVNMAIIPNPLLQQSDPYGDLSTLARFSRDVASLPGIGAVIQGAGDVDLKANGCVAASVIVPGEQQFIAMAHAAGIRVVLPTIPPSTYCGQSNSAPRTQPPNTGADYERQQLNAWILSTAPTMVDGMPFAGDDADVIVDFSGAVDDPTNAGYMLPQYALDLSHPNAAGQAAQAATIPVNQL